MKIPQKLRDWENEDEDFDLGDELHRYWSDSYKGELDWCAVAEHAAKLFGEMTGTEVETHSLYDAFFHAIAAEAANCAFEAVGRALGFSGEEVSSVADNFYWLGEKVHDPLPPPLGWKEFKARALRHRQFTIDLAAGKLNLPG